MNAMYFVGLEVSPRHPYLFSCGEDRQVKCWDLEYNKVSTIFHNYCDIYSIAFPTKFTSPLYVKGIMLNRTKI